MATLKTNTLTGTSTAGSIAVTGEGNSTTTNLQQGLVKVWHNLDGSGTVETHDSFNVASLTDNGTGDYTSGFTNNMANGNYATVVNCESDSGHIGSIYGEAQTTTSSFRSYVFEVDASGVTDGNVVTFMVAGDLA